MQAVVSFVLLIAVVTVNTAPTESLVSSKTPISKGKSSTDQNLSEPKTEINPIQDGKGSDSGARHKKSTTTFCVEIRPSDPYQKPYEVCESGNHIYTVPIESNSEYKVPSAPYPPASPPASPVYSKPTYAAPKPAPAFITTSNAAFSSSTKTDSSYPKSNHYGSYRSGDESVEESDDEEFERLGIEMEEDDEIMEGMHPLIRSAGYGYDGGYGYGFGGYGGGGYGGGGGGGHGMTLIKFKGAGKKKKKGQDGGMEHHGVVITCQPSLAGYASGITGPIGGGGGGGGMSGYSGGHGGYGGYRDSSGRSSSKYRSKYYSPGNIVDDGYGITTGHGGGKQGGSKSHYGGSSFTNGGGYYSSHNFNGGHRPYASGNSPSFTPSNAFNQASAFASPGTPIHGSGEYFVPTYPFSPVYSQSPHQSSYLPPSSPVFNPPPPPTFNHPSPQANPSSSYGYNLANSAVSSGFTSSATSSGYVPPGTYRVSENSADASMMKTPMDAKEKEMERPSSSLQHTDNGKSNMANMSKVSHSRNSMWNNDMGSSKSQSESMQEEMKQAHQGHMVGNSKWTAENKNNGNTMSDNKPKV